MILNLSACFDWVLTWKKTELIKSKPTKVFDELTLNPALCCYTSTYIIKSQENLSRVIIALQINLCIIYTPFLIKNQ